MATVVSMRTKRHRVAAGAAAITFALFAATACSSESSDPVADAPVPSAVDTTIGDADPPDETVAPTESTATAEEPPTVTDESPTSDPAVVVPEALQFTAPLVGGGTFDGAAVTDKPTVFWFWAPT